jgi:hypothetical protein
MGKCKHKFKSNLDGLAVSNYKDLVYMTVIFCENCGLVAFNANRTDMSEEAQKLIQRLLST